MYGNKINVMERLYLTKGKKGRHYLVGRFSNRWRDWDFHANPANGGEIVASHAHQEFERWLDRNPHHAPELWVWHVWGSAFKNRAHWWGWSGNAMYAAWELTENEAQKVQEWREELRAQGRDLGMSFGFYVLDYDREQGVINKYRAFEASILPLDRAANPWTDVGLFSEEENRREKMAFAQEKLEALRKIHGDRFVEDLLREDEELAKALDTAGYDTKEVDGGAAEEDGGVTAEEEGDVAAEAKEVALSSEYAKSAEVLDALLHIKGIFEEQVKNLSAQLETLTRLVESHQKALDALASKQAELERFAAQVEEDAKMAAAPSGLLAALLRSESVVGVEKAAVDGRTSLAKQGPAVSNANPLIQALFQRG